MLGLLASLLDVVLDVIGWVLWAPAMYAFWLMRRGQREYRALWRGALRLTEKSDEENERLRAERDEMTSLNANLLDILDASEERWSALESEQQAQAEAARQVLQRAIEKQREERDRKEAEIAARLMAQRAIGPRLVGSATFARLAEEYGREIRRVTGSNEPTSG